MIRCKWNMIRKDLFTIYINRREREIIKIIIKLENEKKWNRKQLAIATHTFILISNVTESKPSLMKEGLKKGLQKKNDYKLLLLLAWPAESVHLLYTQLLWCLQFCLGLLSLSLSLPYFTGHFEWKKEWKIENVKKNWDIIIDNIETTTTHIQSDRGGQKRDRE